MEEELVPPALIPAIRDVIHALVRGDYAALEADGRAGRVRAVDLERVVEAYPATLVDPPENAFESERNACATLVDGDDPYWDIDARLWTAEAGRSNLTLRLIARQTDEGYRIEISDLLVP